MKAAKSLFVLAIVGSAALVGNAPALMGPHFIILTGGPLTERVMITDASELMRLTCALDGGAPVPRRR